MTFDDWIKLIDILKWPVVFLVFALIVLFVLKATVRSLMDRVKRAEIGDKAIDFRESAAIASEQQQKVIEKSVTADAAPAGELPPPPASPGLAAIEQSVNATLAASNASEETKRLWLIRGVSVARMERAHEITYRLIMGSQIALLLRANTGVPVSMEAARGIYEEAKKNFSTIYTTFDFDGWLSWMANTGLVKLESQGVAGQKITITDIGKEFLHYLVSAGLTSTKVG